jgi:hypothetical protein
LRGVDEDTSTEMAADGGVLAELHGLRGDIHQKKGDSS